MSNQFGHNRDRRRQSQMQAAASGLAALGRHGSVNQFGGGRPIQQHPSLAGSAAGSTVHGASAAAMGAYGSIGSTPRRNRLLDFGSDVHVPLRFDLQLQVGASCPTNRGVCFVGMGDREASRA